MSDQDLDIRVGEPPLLPADSRHFPTHPLFPLPEGVRETKEIHEITFDRWNDKGVKERCPDRFRAVELTSLAQVVDMFGGGTYQFIAFDSRGNFSRWTPEKEKIRVDLPSKPFRQVERAEPGLESPSARAAVPQPPPGSPPDYMALIMQQSIAAQERADRLMAALIERLASPQPSQERSDRIVAALIERLAAPPPQPPPPPPPADPMVMLTGVATVLEKLRPAQSGDMVSQLSGLVSVLKQLKRADPGGEPSSDDVAIQPFLTMVTNAMMQNKGAPSQRPNGNSPPAAPPQSPPPTPPDLVWVYLPDHGPVLMRVEQAARTVGSRKPTQAEQATSSAATAPSALAVAPPPAPPPAPQAVAPTPTSAAPPPPPPSTPEVTAAPDTAPEPATPTPPAAPTPPPPVQRCFVCAEPGRLDPADSTILLCPRGHRSLASGSASTPASTSAATPAPPVSIPPSTAELLGHDLSGHISLSRLDALLADPEALRSMSPQMAAAIRQVRGQIGSS